VKAAAVSVGALAAVFLFAASAEALPYPVSAFTISPASAAKNCLTLQERKELTALPCTGAPDQQFTYDAATKHLANGNGVCVAAAGRFGINLAGVPCGDTKNKPILVEENAMGSSTQQPIKYQSHAASNTLCFNLIRNGGIGGQTCSGGAGQDFATKPVVAAPSEH
jgi:hypothetical protein